MKYKVIKSVAHNFGHSFVSLMNYRGDDYVMSHLARLVVETGCAELSVDLMTGRAAPRALLWGPVGASLADHVQWFPQLLVGQGVEPSAVAMGRMNVLFRPQQRSVHTGFANAWAIPFECVVTLGDDRGKLHEGRVQDSWIVDDSFAPPRWLRSIYWWRSELRGWFLRRRLSARPANSSSAAMLATAVLDDIASEQKHD
jgi:hypothetical protein